MRHAPSSVLFRAPALARADAGSTPPADGASPAMAQWFAAKARHPDALIFFRMGDFYELFFEDAAKAAAALDIQLTHRGIHAGEKIAMCGVPLHAAESYLARLIRKGFRVAIAEQLEDPRTRFPRAKAPLRRDVVRLVTPGTLTEETLLDPARPNLLLALSEAGSSIGAAWADISSGRFETELVGPDTLPDLLAQLAPAEILAPPAMPLGPFAALRAPQTAEPAPPVDCAAEPEPADPAWRALSAAESAAAARLVAYLRHTQAGALPRLGPPTPANGGMRLRMDGATRANLGLVSPRGTDAPPGLTGVIGRTLTGAGARHLAERIAAPSTERATILGWQALWVWLLANQALLQGVRARLAGMPEIQRALGRIALGRAHPRDLGAIAASLRGAAGLAGCLDHPALPADFVLLRDRLGALPDLGRMLAAALAETLPARLGDGDSIRAGFDAELDRLRDLRDHGRQALGPLQATLAGQLGIPTLKIRHHQQLGYFAEVPASMVERLRAEPGFVLRQSLAGAARFSCPPLVDLDQAIATAAEQAGTREAALWQDLATAIVRAGPALDHLAETVATLDVAQAAAALAQTGHWCRPELTEDLAFQIHAGRHPVVEAALPAGARFIANGCDLGPGRRVLLLTGPNMAGKSTYLRQNALIAVLAQAGLPVPADAARIGIVDRLFCRVGAADDLARGRSTFMVEMEETAAILHRASARSLLVIDEIGRGTATLDGLAIAWSVLESIHDVVRARTLFATHFHELVRLQHELPDLSPHTMRVRSWRGRVVFLHEVEAGAAGRSFGVEVAKLAGIPAPVVKRAEIVLRALEARAAGLTQDVELPLLARTDGAPPAPAASDRLNAALEALAPDKMSPLDALRSLYELKELARGLALDDPP